jgi:hypothetical protein
VSGGVKAPELPARDGDRGAGAVDLAHIGGGVTTQRAFLRTVALVAGHIEAGLAGIDRFERGVVQTDPAHGQGLLVRIVGETGQIAGQLFGNTGPVLVGIGVGVLDERISTTARRHRGNRRDPKPIPLHLPQPLSVLWLRPESAG